MDLIDKRSVFANLEVDSSDQVIDVLSKSLFDQNRVISSFGDAVKAREIEYPTGIPSGDITVAIPHTDVKYVKQASLAFATLKKPVAFRNMGDKSQTLDVQIVVMLAMVEPHSQVTVLQSLMSLFQEQDYLKELLTLDKQEDLYEHISKYFKSFDV
ncbi:hypothetical protein FC70_GL001201 [Paucilactobacillus oligofermentans DSM 15707 = LMG 22743]|uniref:PTS EIIA type-2 domain-containing protein n=1 Tax=Paucilactobacillus oligofermentans DSM 15707 = LMG 22743 TaxID=1423778 RepID=A0A0R1RFC3_9LACO|nr:PTS sugar transporter subunit IIA [Paucilactobacillus oligofermentans]KRL55599.1 hypothetical protein FC70_GL001201 [Paucilactobacillus oligofermentans DSM 15707 = LMG 22743]CUS25412.1 PTS system sugar-specific enzyme IIA component [Paucilactobacillus oligofermentans DSM 15707 = LMG 22743]